MDEVAKELEQVLEQRLAGEPKNSDDALALELIHARTNETLEAIRCLLSHFAWRCASGFIHCLHSWSRLLLSSLCLPVSEFHWQPARASHSKVALWHGATVTKAALAQNNMLEHALQGDCGGAGTG